KGQGTLVDDLTRRIDVWRAGGIHGKPGSDSRRQTRFCKRRAAAVKAGNVTFFLPQGYWIPVGAASLTQGLQFFPLVGWSFQTDGRTIGSPARHTVCL